MMPVPFTMRLRRTVAGIATVALTGTLMATAPIAAEATTTYAISGRVSFAANPKLTLSRQAAIGVFDSKCRSVDQRVVSLKWAGNRYTLRLNRPGSYRVVYYGFAQSKRAPYGMQSAACRKTTKVRLSDAHRSARQNLFAVANGMVDVRSKSLRVDEHFVFFDAKTKQAIPGFGTRTPPAGSYKLAKARWSAAKNRMVPIAVFGTRTRSLSKGRIVVVRPARALSVNFDTGSVKRVKDASYRAKVVVAGTNRIGGVLTARTSGFTAGMKLSYRWSTWTAAGEKVLGRGPTYTLRESDGESGVSVTVTGRKSGHLTRKVANGRWVAPWELVLSPEPTLVGAENGLVAPNSMLSVSEAQPGLTMEYKWFIDGVLLGEEANFTIGAEPDGTLGSVRVVYRMPHYAMKVWETEFTVGNPTP